MRKLNVLILTKQIDSMLDNKDIEKYINIYYSEQENVMFDIVIVNDAVLTKKFSNSKIWFNYSINGFNTPMYELDNIELYFTFSLHDYEELYFRHGINKENIVLIEKDKTMNYYSKLLNEYVRRNKKLLYDIQIDFSNNKWMTNSSKVCITSKDKALILDSLMDNDEFTYINYKDIINKNKITNFLIEFNCDITSEVNVQLFIITYEKNIKKDVYIIQPNNKQMMQLHNKVDNIVLKLRIKGRGKCTIKGINFIELEEEDINEVFLGRKTNDKYLILTNIYPSYNDLYRNGFIHRRVLAYKSYGIDVDVFTFDKKNTQLSKYEFDTVNVYNGYKDHLRLILRYHKYNKILIHFVNEEMIKAIQNVNQEIPIIIWIHGYETERWHRRIFNYTEKEIEENKDKWELADNKKMAFMKSIYQNPKIKFIFVSKWFKEEVAEVDADCMVANYEVIPNVVDTDIFKYREKPSYMRKKILTIRPFASKKYANDLTVNAILELSKEDFFNDLEFSIYGKGPLFDEILQPIKNFKNVKIHNMFLKQEEIAKLHKQHGIFICPTRLDAQGVSMCEAMSSGLVPITNGVTAIPEYVPEDCGILAPEEDYKQLAQGIKYLYEHPDAFKSFSKSASEFIVKRCSQENVIIKELKIIKEI